MQGKSWFSSSLDILAMLSLVGAVITLGGALWFAEIVPASLMFMMFHCCLAAAIIGFMVSRLAEISRVLSVTPTPKLQRTDLVTERATDAGAVSAADALNVVAEGKFPRAA